MGGADGARVGVERLAMDAPLAESRALCERVARSVCAHTPGPWQVTARGRIAGDGHLLVMCDTGYVSPAEEAANARLIAAAPDLLAACRAAEARYAAMWGVGGGKTGAERDQIRAAIAKATGQEPTR
jgi:hypothetical protein